MYFAVIQQFQRTLRALDAILSKAVLYAEAKKFDPDNFCTARLTPDMLPFTRQIQIACDSGKRAAAALVGKEAPVHEDTEQTLAQLQERIGKCLAYLATFREKDFDAVTPKTEVKLLNPPGKAMYADDALLGRSIPNFFFHVTIAYALLRRRCGHRKDGLSRQVAAHVRSVCLSQCLASDGNLPRISKLASCVPTTGGEGGPARFSACHAKNARSKLASCLRPTEQP